MALEPKATLTHPIQIGLTAGSDSGVALLIGSGSPDGNTDPWLSAGKGSLHIRIDATDDYGPLYAKVDDDGADDDWVHVIVDKEEDDIDLEGHVTLDTDKRVYFRGTDTSIYSDSACKLYVSTPSGMDIEKVMVGSGTTISHVLVGSGVAVFGALAASAASATSLAVTGLTQDHKIFLSASDISGCLNVASISCSPGGGVLKVGVVNAASEAYAGGTETFAYLAIAACM